MRTGQRGTHFVVGFPSARSMAQATAPLWSQPYASTPTVLPANSRRCEDRLIELRSGRSPLTPITTVTQPTMVSVDKYGRVVRSREGLSSVGGAWAVTS